LWRTVTGGGEVKEVKEIKEVKEMRRCAAHVRREPSLAKRTKNLTQRTQRKDHREHGGRRKEKYNAEGQRKHKDDGKTDFPTPRPTFSTRTKETIGRSAQNHRGASAKTGTACRAPTKKKAGRGEEATRPGSRPSRDKFRPASAQD
jgi:hypothetical protein